MSKVIASTYSMIGLDIAPRPYPITCPMCGRQGLHWKNIEGEWFKVSDRGVIHVCPEIRKETDERSK